MSRKSSLPDDGPPSPCIKVCKVDPVRRRCTGCLRTLDEIGAWSFMSADEKQAVLDALPARRAEGRRRGQAR